MMARQFAGSPHDRNLADFVTFTGVDKTYDGKSFVIRDLNLTISCGEFVSLLGPSGSGKTTTLMMLAGFESASRGDIHLDGQRVNDLPSYQREIGMVFQNYALFPHMTVAENVAFPLSVRKVPKAEIDKRVRQALAMIELPGVAERKPAQLSGGQQQRVALARAMIFEPRLILMDEPLGALDKRLRETMQYEIKKLHRRLGTTIVYVTHDQSEALTMSDRVAVFSDGDIQQIATPDRLYEDPANAFVASFIGENNGLKGKVAEIRGSQAVLALPDGARVTGAAGEGLSLGAEAILALRPERVALARSASATGNELKGKVDDVTYCGDHRRVQLSTADGQGFIVKIPNDQQLAVPKEGEAISVHWQEKDCKVVI
ncbi:MAG: ABC transporter ATP-binding protein [Parvibaculaceae bacterium]